MTKSRNTKKTEETKPKYHCEFCEKEFIFESGFTKHLCVYKKRWIDRDHRANKLAYDAWTHFYNTNTISGSAKKTRPYEEFIKSPYYASFVKFGNYCIDISCINTIRFVDYLLREKVKLSNWNSDKNYTQFLIEYIRLEDPMDAVKRTVNHCLDLAEEENIQVNDVLRYGNRNRICHSITTGRISPWVLYQSESGVKLLDTLSTDQVKMIYDYINPTNWAIKFNKDPEKVLEIKQLLTELKW